MRERITVYVDHDENESDYVSMLSWLKKWEQSIHVENYSTGGWEHIWNIEAPEIAVKEIPNDWLCSSEWAGV